MTLEPKRKIEFYLLDFALAVRVITLLCLRTRFGIMNDIPLGEVLNYLGTMTSTL